MLAYKGLKWARRRFYDGEEQKNSVTNWQGGFSFAFLSKRIFYSVQDSSLREWQ
jgi:hypothetical protein